MLFEQSASNKFKLCMRQCGSMSPAAQPGPLTGNHRSEVAHRKTSNTCEAIMDLPVPGRFEWVMVLVAREFRAYANKAETVYESARALTS